MTRPSFVRGLFGNNQYFQFYLNSVVRSDFPDIRGGAAARASGGVWVARSLVSNEILSQFPAPMKDVVSAWNLVFVTSETRRVEGCGNFGEMWSVTSLSRDWGNSPALTDVTLHFHSRLTRDTTEVMWVWVNKSSNINWSDKMIQLVSGLSCAARAGERDPQHWPGPPVSHACQT